MPDCLVWKRALAAYRAARRAHERHVQQAYRHACTAMDAELPAEMNVVVTYLEKDGTQASLSLANVCNARQAVRRVEEAIRGKDGSAADVRAYRRIDVHHRALRQLAAAEWRAQRFRHRLIRKHRIFELEEIGNRLAITRAEQMHELIAAPAPDMQALATKLEVSYVEYFRNEPDIADMMACILDDVQRLVPGSVTPNLAD